MGLSNEERITKAVWAANRITNLANQLDPESDDFRDYETRKKVERLKTKCLELIPSLLGGRSNSLFWLLGSDESVGFHSTRLWSIALRDKIKYAKTPEASAELEERKQKKGDTFNKEFEKREHKLFEVEGNLSEQLLHVYTINQWCEAFLYATNRYQDKLSDSYRECNGKIAHIMNECFNIFEAEDDYAIAYLKAQIFPLLIGAKKYSKYADWDALTRFVVENYLLHRLNQYRDQWDPHMIDTLKCWWIDLESSSSKQARFEIWLELIAANTLDKPKSLEKFKEIAAELKIRWKKDYDKLIKTKSTEYKERIEAQSSSYSETKQYDKEDIQHRETDAFHFLLNDE